MVLKVRDDYIAIGCKTNAPRRRRSFQELCGIRGFKHELGDVSSVAGEQLNAMISRVSDYDITQRVDRNIPRILELPTFFAERTELKYEITGRCKDLHSMIILIDDNYPAVGVCGDSCG